MPGPENDTPRRPATFEASVLVSGEGLMATLHGMREKCHFMDFLDFCTLAEAMVLNDKIEVVCDVEYAYGLSSTAELTKLQDAGIISAISTHRGDSSMAKAAAKEGIDVKDIGSSRFTLRGTEVTRREPLGTFSLDQVMDEATTMLRAERELGVSALPLRRFAPLYVPNAKVREEHTVCDLMGRYEELSAALKKNREAMRFRMAPLVLAQIPPIPVTVLQHARTGAEILDRILEVRDDFRSLRESLTQLRRDLSDEEIHPKEKRGIIQSWLRSWSTLSKYTAGTTVALGNTTSEMLDVDKSFDSETIDLKLSKIFDFAVKQATSGFYRWRVRMLHQTAERYFKISDGQIARDLERIYKKSFGDKDLRDLQDWEKMISLMPIDLEGMSPKQQYIIERSGDGKT